MSDAEARDDPVTHRIQFIALQILKDFPNGIRYGELTRAVMDQDPTFRPGTVRTQVSTLANDPNRVRRIARGVLGAAETVVPPTSGADESQQTKSASDKAASPLNEVFFYEPFAQWLSGPGDRTTAAIALGYAGLKAMWGTPDVVGVYRPTASDLVKFPVEIVSAEIKTDANQSIVAFGQAISYRLFSHKTIIAMPSEIKNKEEDHSRLESLCQLFGVGYVLFDKSNLEDPNFTVAVPPRRFDPDMFYVNVFARQLHDRNRSHFNVLFWRHRDGLSINAPHECAGDSPNDDRWRQRDGARRGGKPGDRGFGRSKGTQWDAIGRTS